MDFDQNIALLNEIALTREITRLEEELHACQRRPGTKKRSKHVAKRRRKAKKVGGRMKCPAKYKGHKVRRIKGGGCAIRKKNGQMRFVKKVRARRKRR